MVCLQIAHDIRILLTKQAPLPPTERRPSARTLRHQRITGQIHPLVPAKTFRSDAAVSDTFLSSKRDKRLIKHSSFLSRVTSSPSNTTRITKSKTRRPGNKLKTDLDGLADALPDLDAAESGPRDGKVRHKSLNSKKGALKRKEKVVKGEMERFGASMARLSGVQEEQAGKGEETSGLENKSGAAQVEAAPAPATTNRWAALRGYISSTMEQNPAFAKA